MTRSRADVFFYGLFMDPDILRENGATPVDPELGSLSGYALAIGQRAWLSPRPTGIVHGVVTSLSFDELSSLYSTPSLRAYVPMAVLLDVSGTAVPALWFNLAHDSGAPDPEYVARLCTTGRKVGLPEAYIAAMGTSP